ncbi:MAG: class I SAM-dependent methyltransferase, partial [Peptococcaceae bacterium]|nr:class I SAM-dependent methyltransferase [Peptococcaceae bacterium]
MEGKSQYVQEVFTEIADDYDQMNNKMTWGMLKGWQ